MQNNNSTNYPQEDEIDLKEIFKILMNSKKLIIAITLVTAILGAIYSVQKAPRYISTVVIEIGSYDAEINNPKIKPNQIGTKVLVESLDSLIKNLKINFIYKQKMNFKIKPIEGRLIKIDTQSDNPEMNIDLLNKIIEFIKNRHSILLQKVEFQLTSKIENLNNEIEYNNNALLTQHKDEKLRISNQIENLNNEIEYKNNALLTQHKDEKLRISNQIENLNNEIEYKNNALLTQHKDEKLRISNQIENLNNEIEYKNNALLTQHKEIEYKNNALLTQHKNKKLRISNQIQSLKNLLPNIELKIEELKKIIIKDETNLKLLQSNEKLLLERAAQSPTLEQIIFNYKASIIENENEIIKLSQEIDNLEVQLQLEDQLQLFFESNGLDSGDIFTLSQAKDNLEAQLKLLGSNGLDSGDIFTLSQVKDNLEAQLKLLGSNGLDSGEIFILSQVKDNLEAQLKLLGSNGLDSGDIFTLSQAKDNLEAQLKLLGSNGLDSGDIFILSQEKDNLDLELESLTRQNTTNTQLIGEIVTSPIDSKKEFTIFVSFIFGFFLSIVVVFINNSLKALKEE